MLCEQQWLVPALAVLTFGISFIIFIRNLNKDRESQREAIYKTIAVLEAKHDADMYKLRAEVAGSFVNTKICEIVHKNSDATINRIEDTITKIFDKLEELTKYFFGDKSHDRRTV